MLNERTFQRKIRGEVEKNKTVKISSSGNIAKIFSKTQISLQRDEIQF